MSTPHWLAVEPGGNRLVITGYGALQTHALFATIDQQTGELTLDPESINFTRELGRTATPAARFLTAPSSATSNGSHHATGGAADSFVRVRGALGDGSWL
jgi:hypothetical protein